MVKVYRCKNEYQMGVSEWQSAINILPYTMHEYILRYRLWPDRQATLIGKLLLRKALAEEVGMKDEIIHMKKNKFQRPYLPLKIDFNISHTKGLVVCAFSENCKVGIDVEYQKLIRLRDFKSVFTPQEWELLQSSSNWQDLFYTLWTIKEAVMKADGRGMSLPPSSFSGLSPIVSIEENEWWISPLELDDKWKGHLCTDQETSIVYKDFELNQLAADF